MAVLQALLSLLSRSVGRLVSATFGWAVVALFGETSPSAKMWLSGLVATAAAWPILVLGVAAPKIASFALAFVPIPHSVPTWAVRMVWVALALIVPLAVGLTVALRRPIMTALTGGVPPAIPESKLKRTLRGFPITIGLAAAFLIVFVTVPSLRIASLLRRRLELQIPLVPDVDSYDTVAEEIARTLTRYGFRVRAAPAPWWMSTPSRVLLWADRASFSAYVPERFAYYRSDQMEVALYPNGLLLRGAADDLTLAHGALAEALTATPSFQTFAPEAQSIEKQIRRLWQVYRQNPRVHRNAAVLLARLDEIGRNIHQLPVSYDEWQIVYRQALQLGRALGGEQQLLEAASSKYLTEATMDEHVRSTSSLTTPTARAAKARAEALSTRDLVAEITHNVSRLVRTEVELAKAELKANLGAELLAVKAMAVAIVLGVMGLSTLCVALVVALAQIMAAWLAAILVGGILLVAAGVLGWIGWSWHVKTPLAMTRQTLKEDVQWAKERAA